MTGVQRPTDDVSFREMQQFRQLWLWVLILPFFLLMVGVFGFGLIWQLALGNQFGSKPMSDVVLIVTSGAVFAIMGAVMYILFASRLIFEAPEDALHIRFSPFFHRRIPYDQIERCEVRSYSSIAEYGGWGIRWHPRKGWAYNVSGSRGVQLELSGGKRALLGSDRAEELVAAIQHRMTNQTKSGSADITG